MNVTVFQAVCALLVCMLVTFWLAYATGYRDYRKANK